MKRLAERLRILGNLLIFFGLLGVFFLFGPAAKEEIRFRIFQVNPALVSKLEGKDLLEPVSTDFGIVIPKLAANAPVFANANPFDPRQFLPVLLRGVAHAKGTAFPGEVGNVYLFAHSTDSPTNVGRYNAVFYLIGKLEPGDEIWVFYKGDKYIYKVEEKKVVVAEAIKYLGILEKGAKTLTLQTCYPPGTTLKRLVVIAKEVESFGSIP